MLGTVIIVSLLLGVGSAYGSIKFSSRGAMLERFGGACLMLGLALLGGSLPYCL